MTHQEPSRRCSHLVPPKLLLQRPGRVQVKHRRRGASSIHTAPSRTREKTQAASLEHQDPGRRGSPAQVGSHRGSGWESLPPHPLGLHTVPAEGKLAAFQPPRTLYRHAPRTPEVSAAAARCPQTTLLPGTALPSEGWGQGAGRAACARGHTPTPRKAHPRTRHRTSCARADVAARGASMGPSDKGLTVPTAEPRPDTRQLCRNPALSTARADRGAAVPRRPGRHRSERMAAGQSPVLPEPRSQ